MRYFYQSIYQDTVDALRNVFTRLELILDGVACIKFADPEVKRICVKNWDDDGNGEINVSEAGWKIQCKLPPKTKRFCPLVLK